MGRQCSLTLATIIESTGETVAAQQSLDFLPKVGLDNRIALEYLLAEQEVRAVANIFCCSWINTSGIVVNAGI